MDEKLVQDALLVFNESFRADLPLEVFRHKHLDNPELMDATSIAVDYCGDTPRGLNCFMALPLLVGSQVVKSMGSCDTAVCPAYRRQHIFYHIIERILEEYRANDVDLIYALPNQNSYHGFQKLGFYELGKMTVYARILKPVPLFARKVLHCPVAYPPFSDDQLEQGGYTYRFSTECPFSEKDIAEINSRASNHFYRSRAFYAWKFDYLPKGERAYLCARQGDSLIGFLAVRKQSYGTGEICDWMLPDDQIAAQAALRVFCKYLRRFCDVIQVWVNPQSREPQTFSGAGFYDRKQAIPFLIMPTSPQTSATAHPKLYDLSSWELRSIDNDTILNG